MAFSGAQITRLGVSGTPRQLFGSFAAKGSGPVFGPHPVVEITRLGVSGIPRQLYGSFADKGEGAATGKSGVRRLQQARDFSQQDPDWNKGPRRTPVVPGEIPEEIVDAADHTVEGTLPGETPEPVQQVDPLVADFVDLDVAKVHAVERLKAAQAEAAEIEAVQAPTREAKRVAAERLAFLQDEEEAMLIILMAADM